MMNMAGMTAAFSFTNNTPPALSNFSERYFSLVQSGGLNSTSSSNANQVICGGTLSNFGVTLSGTVAVSDIVARYYARYTGTERTPHFIPNGIHPGRLYVHSHAPHRKHYVAGMLNYRQRHQLQQ